MEIRIEKKKRASRVAARSSSVCVERAISAILIDAIILSVQRLRVRRINYTVFKVYEMLF